jgi:hypothetical protein
MNDFLHRSRRTVTWLAEQEFGWNQEVLNDSAMESGHEAEMAGLEAVDSPIQNITFQVGGYE